MIFTGGLAAEVIDQGDHVFKIRSILDVPLPMDTVFEKFANIGSWWNPEHTFGGDATRYRLDLARMGLIETLDEGFVKHMDIVYWNPGHRIVLKGGLGPLLTEAVVGVMIVDFEANEGSTRVALKYTVTGIVENGSLGNWAPAVDYVIGEQMHRLRVFLEQDE